MWRKTIKYFLARDGWSNVRILGNGAIMFVGDMNEHVGENILDYDRVNE